MELTLGPANLSTEFKFSLPDFETSRYKNIGIYSSGGLDSTALICLILSELKNNNLLGVIPVTCFTVVKAEGSTYYSQRVIEKISAHFDYDLLHVNNVGNDKAAVDYGRVGRTPIFNIRSNYRDTALYMGVNRMAPDDIRPFTQVLQLYYKDQPFLYNSPFLNMHKPQILDLYFKLACEDIIQYTHSCTVQALGACGECYSCNERKWGFDALGKVDPGTVTPSVDDITFDGTWVNA